MFGDSIYCTQNINAIAPAEALINTRKATIKNKQMVLKQNALHHRKRCTFSRSAASITGLNSVSTHWCWASLSALDGICPHLINFNPCRFINTRACCSLLFMPDISKISSTAAAAVTGGAVQSRIKMMLNDFPIHSY